MLKEPQEDVEKTKKTRSEQNRIPIKRQQFQNNLRRNYGAEKYN